MNIDTSRAMQGVQDSFTDVNSLDNVKEMGRRKDPEALRKIAQQFESMFMQQMLKNMRSTNDIFSEGNDLKSNEGDFHQQMFDHQMALEMTKGKGMGLADVLFRQMSAQYGDEFKVDSNEPRAPKKSIQDYLEVAPSILPPAKNMNRESDLDVVSTQPVNTLGGKQAAALSPEAFIQQFLSQATAAAQKLNVKPEVLLAQAALETGWGKHVIHNGQGDNSHNLFNIKADQRWDGNSVKVPTLEYREGIAAKEQANFRSYKSYSDSFGDYVEFIQGNPRYQKALQSSGDPEAYTRELQQAGYATDPHYAQKINRLMNGDVIQQAVQQQQQQNPLSMARLGAEGGS